MGRAGRDGKKSRAILHYRQEDHSLRRFLAVKSAVDHPEWGRGTVMGYDDGVVTVLFETVGCETLSADLVERKELLTSA